MIWKVGSIWTCLLRYCNKLQNITCILLLCSSGHTKVWEMFRWTGNNQMSLALQYFCMNVTVSSNWVTIWLLLHLQAGNSLSVLRLCLPWECSKYSLFNILHNATMGFLFLINVKIPFVKDFLPFMFASTFDDVQSVISKDFRVQCLRSWKILQKGYLRF